MKIGLFVGTLLIALVSQEMSLARDKDTMDAGSTPTTIRTRQIFVRIPTEATTYAFEVDLISETVDMLKAKISEKTNFPQRLIGLFYLGRILSNNKATLSSLGVEAYTTLCHYFPTGPFLNGDLKL